MAQHLANDGGDVSDGSLAETEPDDNHNGGAPSAPMLTAALPLAALPRDVAGDVAPPSPAAPVSAAPASATPTSAVRASATSASAAPGSAAPLSPISAVPASVVPASTMPPSAIPATASAAPGPSAMVGGASTDPADFKRLADEHDELVDTIMKGMGAHIAGRAQQSPDTNEDVCVVLERLQEEKEKAQSKLDQLEMQRSLLVQQQAREHNQAMARARERKQAVDKLASLGVAGPISEGSGNVPVPQPPPDPLIGAIETAMQRQRADVEDAQRREQTLKKKMAHADAILAKELNVALGYASADLLRVLSDVVAAASARAPTPTRRQGKQKVGAPSSASSTAKAKGSKSSSASVVIPSAASTTAIATATAGAATSTAATANAGAVASIAATGTTMPVPFDPSFYKLATKGNKLVDHYDADDIKTAKTNLEKRLENGLKWNSKNNHTSVSKDKTAVTKEQMESALQELQLLEVAQTPFSSRCKVANDSGEKVPPTRAQLYVLLGCVVTSASNGKTIIHEGMTTAQFNEQTNLHDKYWLVMELLRELKTVLEVNHVVDLDADADIGDDDSTRLPKVGEVRYATNQAVSTPGRPKELSNMLVECVAVECVHMLAPLPSHLHTSSALLIPADLLLSCASLPLCSASKTRRSRSSTQAAARLAAR